MTSAPTVSIDAKSMTPQLMEKLWAKMKAEQAPPTAYVFPLGNDTKPREVSREEFNKIIGASELKGNTKPAFSSLSLTPGQQETKTFKPMNQKPQEALQITADMIQPDSYKVLQDSVFAAGSAASQAAKSAISQSVSAVSGAQTDAAPVGAIKSNDNGAGRRRRPDGQESGTQQMVKVVSKVVDELQQLNLTLKRILEKLN